MELVVFLGLCQFGFQLGFLYPAQISIKTDAQFNVFSLDSSYIFSWPPAARTTTAASQLTLPLVWTVLHPCAALPTERFW